MSDRQKSLALGLSLLVFIPTAFARGQIGSGLGGQPGLGGGARGTGGVRGLSNPRSGLGFRSNPIANPAPSLTPHEVFNPRGSLSAGQVLNPAPSLRRPRSGGTAAMRYQPGAATGSMDRAVPRSYSVRTRRQSVNSSPMGQQLQQSAATLKRQLTQLAPNKGWEAHLSVEAIRNVRSSSEQPIDTEQRELLQSVLRRYDAVAANEQYTIISRMPAFQQTVSTLRAYLRPIDERRRLTLRAYFDQLGDQLQLYTNGESWAEYLALPKELFNDETADGAAESARRLLKRFDKVSSDPTYAMVTALPAFEPAHKVLRLIVDLPATSSPPLSPANPQSIPVREPSPAGDVPTKAGPGVSDTSEPLAADPAPPGIPLGERILESVVELDRQLGKVAPNSAWPKRLSLDELRGIVDASGEQPANDVERKSLEDILATYEAVAKNEKDAVVNGLPKFKETLEALQAYLTPLDTRRPKEE